MLEVKPEEYSKLSNRKKLELKWYPMIKVIYVRLSSWYGFYWGYKLIRQNFEVPIWEQWIIWLIAMMGLFFFSREERLDGFFDKKS